MKWLHLGLGHFHKAHQAWYVERLNQLGANWEITSLSMTRPDAALELASQNFSYEVLATDYAGSESFRVKSIKHTAFAGEATELLRQFSQDRELAVISLTVTEKGYDLNGPALRALEQLLTARTHPVTILSCDNLQHNGRKLEKLLRERMVDKFPSCVVSFPNTMVDRIVPNAPRGAPVKTERFSQWVIENDFMGVRPELERVGVQFVSDVTPYELMKLRLLNAGHSLMAYWGLNRGFEFVHQVVNDSAGRAELLALWQEVIPLLELPSDIDPRAYTETLLTRFNNPGLPHRLSQIATDGSVKLPQRIYPSLTEAKRRGSAHRVLASVEVEWRKALSELPSTLFNDPIRSSP
jgi:fructuronate reductase